MLIRTLGVFVPTNPSVYGPLGPAVSATVAVGAGILPNTITVWTFTLYGTHVPEPASFALAVLGLGTVVPILNRRKALRWLIP